jgi:hypothetical protein
MMISAIVTAIRKSRGIPPEADGPVWRADEPYVGTAWEWARRRPGEQAATSRERSTRTRVPRSSLSNPVTRVAVVATQPWWP